MTDIKVHASINQILICKYLAVNVLMCIVLKSGVLFTYACILVFRGYFFLMRDHPGKKAAKDYFPASHFSATRLGDERLK